MPSSYADFGGLIRKIIGAFTVLGLLTAGSLSVTGTSTFNDIIINGTCTGPGCGGGGSVGSATTTYLDNIPVRFGTDGDFEIRYRTTGNPDAAIITTPTSSQVISLVSQEFKDFDYVNAGISAGNPTLLFLPATSTRNRLGSLSTNNTEFTVSAMGGNDLNGTAQNADGTNLHLRTSNGGSIGTHMGGYVQITLGTGTAGGSDGYIISGGSVVDMPFKMTPTGAFKIIDSGSSAALTFDHDGTNGVVSSTFGEINIQKKVSIGDVFSPTFYLDVMGDGRFSATGTQQLLYTNASGTEGLAGIRSYVAPATGIANTKNFLGVIDSQNAKTAGTTSIFSGQISVNGSDSGGTYNAFEAQSAVASNATSVGMFIGTGYDFSVLALSGKANFAGSTKIGGGQHVKARVLTFADSPYTINPETDYAFSINSTGGAISIILPSATTTNQFMFEDTYGSGAITIYATSTDMIEGASSWPLGIYEGVVLIGDGVNRYIVPGRL